MDNEFIGVALFIGLAAMVGLFFLLRKVALWYFRINDIVDLLTKQLNNQREILKHLTGKEEEPKKPE